MLGELARRFWFWLNRRRMERELREEIEGHRAAMTDPERFGSLLRVREDAAEAWAWVWLDRWRNDWRQAARTCVRNPGFGVAVGGILALGIGANTAIFSLIDAALLQSLPYEDPHELVMLWEETAGERVTRRAVAPGDFSDWHSDSRSFSGMAALDWRSFDVTGKAEPEKVFAYAVSAEFFEVLGVAPQLGRGFALEEDELGASPVVVISAGLWRSRFGSDPSVIGESIRLNEQQHTIIGVMPQGFQFLEGYISLWTPLTMDAEEAARRDEGYLQVVGRLKPGVPATAAQSDLDDLLREGAREYPEQLEGRTAAVVPLRDQLTGAAGSRLAMLLPAVGLILLIACANVGGLLLARGVSRRKEFALRAAIGAGSGRLRRQLLVETLLVALPSGALGVLSAGAAFPVLERLLPEGLRAPLQLDVRAVAFTAFVSLAAAILCCLAPAIKLSGLASAGALRQGGGGSGRGQKRLQAGLVVAEVAAATVLTIGAGLLVQTAMNLTGQYAELRAENVLTLRTGLSPDRYWNAGQRNEFYDEVLEHVEALPGVDAAGYTTSIPLERQDGRHEVVVEGAVEDERPQVLHRQVSEGYLQTMGIALRQGRYLASWDGEESQAVAVVNETMARRLWPGENPIGKRFRLNRGNVWRTVVGVVADVPQKKADAPAEAEMYLPFRQVATHQFLSPRDLVVRTKANPLMLAAAVKDAIYAVDPAQPAALIRTLDAVLAEGTSARRLQGTLLTAFAVLGLLLASLGIYGVVAYSAARQTVEIGIRLALGARPKQVLATVLKHGVGLAASGLAIGLVVSVVLARLLGSLLFGVAPFDLRIYGLTVLLFLTTTVLACLGPAWRAATLKPTSALRGS